jgi:hypothetical protein
MKNCKNGKLQQKAPILIARSPVPLTRCGAVQLLAGQVAELLRNGMKEQWADGHSGGAVNANARCWVSRTKRVTWEISPGQLLEEDQS